MELVAKKMADIQKETNAKESEHQVDKRLRTNEYGSIIILSILFISVCIIGQNQPTLA
ncbi:hypothetical protein LWH96_04890 [Legionella sp. 9fVS26]|nr:hypothetical protein [Legionella sp. PC1000]MCE0722557.1 hypothetical protein [Legionella sp. 9fVS26]